MRGFGDGGAAVSLLDLAYFKIKEFFLGDIL